MIRAIRDWAGFYPMFQRFFDEGLAQASYLIACPRTREAAVVDPRRDVDIYVAAARQQGLTVVVRHRDARARRFRVGCAANSRKSARE